MRKVFGWSSDVPYIEQKSKSGICKCSVREIANFLLYFFFTSRHFGPTSKKRERETYSIIFASLNKLMGRKKERNSNTRNNNKKKYFIYMYKQKQNCGNLIKTKRKWKLYYYFPTFFFAPLSLVRKCVTHVGNIKESAK